MGHELDDSGLDTLNKRLSLFSLRISAVTVCLPSRASLFDHVTRFKQSLFEGDKIRSTTSTIR